MFNILVELVVIIIFNLRIIVIMKLNTAFLYNHNFTLRTYIWYLIWFYRKNWWTLSIFRLDVWVYVLIVFLLQLNIGIGIIQVIICWVYTVNKALVSKWRIYLTIFLLRGSNTRVSTWISSIQILMRFCVVMIHLIAYLIYEVTY